MGADMYFALVAIRRRGSRLTVRHDRQIDRARIEGIALNWLSAYSSSPPARPGRCGC
jgi:hypothetical protein